MITVKKRQENLFSSYKYSSKISILQISIFFVYERALYFFINVAIHIFMLSKYEQKFNKKCTHTLFTYE